jgi:hypothetical protein
MVYRPKNHKSENINGKGTKNNKRTNETKNVYLTIHYSLTTIHCMARSGKNKNAEDGT